VLPLTTFRPLHLQYTPREVVSIARTLTAQNSMVCIILRKHADCRRESTGHLATDDEAIALANDTDYRLGGVC
jgi:hypothetical protein